MTARTPHGMFVAAVRHLIAERWNFRTMRDTRGVVGLEIEEITVENRDATRVHVLRYHSAYRSTTVDQFIPESIPQAIDFLVTAGILPTAMHSLYVDVERRNAGVPTWDQLIEAMTA